MPLTPVILLLIALAGLCDTAWLTHAHLFGAAACGDGSGCDAVMASRYSRVFGIPLAAVGLGFYLALTGLAWRALAPEGRDDAIRWVSLLSLLGVVPTAILLYLQAFVIGSWCPFCLFSSGLLIAILVVSFLDRRRRQHLQPLLGALPGPRQAIPLGIAIATPTLLFLSIEAELASTVPTTDNGAHVAARIGDRQISLAEMDHAIQLGLMEARNDMRNDWLNRQVLETAAREKGVDVRVLLQQTTAGAPVTQADIDRFYEINKAHMPAAMSRQRLDPQIRQQLRQDRARQSRIDYIQQLRQRFGTHLSPPPSERFAFDANPRGGPERGPVDAPVTIIAFSDLECSHCARAHRQLDELHRQFPDDLRVIYRHFPLAMHPDARHAAEVAACADQQTKFWPLVDLLFENQHQLQAPRVRAYAEEVGVDLEQLDACLQADLGRNAVAADMAEGEQLGIHSTPSFFINGYFVKRLPSEDGLKRLIQSAAKADR